MELRDDDFRSVAETNAITSLDGASIGGLSKCRQDERNGFSWSPGNDGAPGPTQRLGDCLFSRVPREN